MDENNILDLDEKIRIAYEIFHTKNEEYNNYLNSIHNNDEDKKIVNKSEKTIKYERIKFYCKLTYYLVFIIDLILYSIFKYPNFIKNMILFGDIIFYFFSSCILSEKMVSDNSLNEVKKVENTNKDQLYKELCEARELYHNLRKKRDSQVVKLSDNLYNDYIEFLQNIDKKEEIIDGAKKKLNLSKERDFNEKI